MSAVKSDGEGPRQQRALGAILVVGAALRAILYFSRPSLTIDEAMLALNIGARTFGGLLRPLALEQTASPGLLFALHAAVRLFGANEYALRLVSLLAGLALPAAVWWLVRKLAPSAPALLAAAATAVSPILIQFSVSAKPYETDALAAACICGLSLALLDAPGSNSRWWTLALGGVIALLFSTPAVLVVAACGVGLASSAAIRAARSGIPRLAAILVLWVCVGGVTYLGVTRAVATDPYMNAFWSGAFLTAGNAIDVHQAVHLLRWFPVQAFAEARPFAQARPYDLPLVLLWGGLAYGCWRLGRESLARFGVMVGPMLALLAAATIRSYPLSPRVNLFVAPLTCALLAVAIDGVCHRWPRAAWPRIHLLTLAVGWIGVISLVPLALRVHTWSEEMRPVAAIVERQHRDAEPVYVSAFAVPGWLFYTTDWQSPDTVRLASVIGAEGTSGNAFHNALGRGHAVLDTEGVHLVVPYRGRPEIIGLAPGIQFREGPWLSQPTPDAGWAAHEVRRIRAATDSVAWLVLGYYRPEDMHGLLVALGPEVESAHRVLLTAGVSLYRVRFKRS
jgi:hypothetical protein